MGVKQANDDELQPIDGFSVLAGNDGTLLRRSKLGSGRHPGRIPAWSAAR